MLPPLLLLSALLGVCSFVRLFSVFSSVLLVSSGLGAGPRGGGDEGGRGGKGDFENAWKATAADV